MYQFDKDSFVQGVYAIVKRIPMGRATSYGAIAKALGYPNMSRLVGRIMGECNSRFTAVPAHRVVNSQGVLSAKNAFTNRGGMQNLLEQEGITVVSDRIADWKNVFWNPLEEINVDD